MGVAKNTVCYYGVIFISAEGAIRGHLRFREISIFFSQNFEIVWYGRCKSPFEGRF
jgi:hypothetical protein